MKLKSKILLFGTGLATAVGAALAFSYSTTKALVSAALDREAPAIISRKKPHHSPIHSDSEMYSALKDSAKKLEETASERIVITSHDNKQLIGHIALSFRSPYSRPRCCSVPSVPHRVHCIRSGARSRILLRNPWTRMNASRAWR